MQKTDDQLITDYLDGNENSLEILVDRYLGEAFTFAATVTGDPQVAEDVVQDSFMKAWKNMRKFVPGNSFRGWLFTIVRNTAIDYLRNKKEVPFSTFDTDTQKENVLTATLADTEPLSDELLARAEDARYINMLLGQLNPEYQEVLTLRHTSNMTFNEIGKVLKRPLHTVKSQHRRGSVALRRLLEAKTT
jgi:RNA polymerase sigma-70 factor (ECF subfamily)